MCHEWTGIKTGLVTMDSAVEKALVTELLENIASIFKSELVSKPDFSRDSDSRCAVTSNPARPKADVILLGGSKLHLFREGISVETISSAINPTAVDICLNSSPLLARSDPSISVILWGLDNICYRPRQDIQGPQG
jgi:hypothetical protein